jgi:YD repeat-containing protein
MLFKIKSLIKLLATSLILIICSKPSIAQSYKYDAANRLVQISSNCTGTKYTYDANGNRLSITQVSIVTTSTVSDEKCGNDGKIVLTAQSTSANYRYQWSNGKTTAGIEGLAAGNYSVVVTEPITGFTCNQQFTIMPVFKDSLTVIAQAPLCIDGSNGKAKIKIVTPNPKGTYSYRWSNSTDTTFRPLDSLSNLKAGSYYVEVRNSFTACIKKIDFKVDPAVDFIAGISSTLPLCYKASNATANVAVTGNPSQYSYAWTGAGITTKTTQQVKGIPAGAYNVTVTKLTTGCSSTRSITINDLQPIFTILKTDATCFQTSNGTATVQLTAGNTNDYSYTWTGPKPGILRTSSIISLPAGKYRVTVTQIAGNHCVGVDSVVINEPASIIRDIVVRPTTCKGQSDGTVEALVSGDANSYSYSWIYNALNLTLPDRTSRVSNLQAGLYTLTVRSRSGDCVASKQFEIKDATIDASSVLYPNPTTGLITVKLCTMITGSVKYSLYSTSGQLLKSGVIYPINGGLALNITQLPPATYVIKIVVDGVTYPMSVIKI